MRATPLPYAGRQVDMHTLSKSFYACGREEKGSDNPNWIARSAAPRAKIPIPNRKLRAA